MNGGCPGDLIECAILLLSRTRKSRSGRSPGHMAGPRNIAWQCCCSVAGSQMNTQFDISISQSIAFHWSGERQLRMGICIKSSPVTPDKSNHIFSQLMNCSHLWYYSYSLLFCLNQNCRACMAGCLLPPGTWLSCHDADLKVQAIAAAVCFVVGCLSGLWQGANTEQPWPCVNCPGRKGNSFRDLLEFWSLLPCDESMEMLSA